MIAVFKIHGVQVYAEPDFLSWGPDDPRIRDLSKAILDLQRFCDMNMLRLEDIGIRHCREPGEGVKILGDTSRAVVTMSGLFVVRVEAYQDDRFRLMFITSHDGKDLRWTPMKFRKGTKTVNLDAEVWPTFEKTIKEAALSMRPSSAVDVAVKPVKGRE